MGFDAPSRCRFATHPWTGGIWPFPVVVAGTICWNGTAAQAKARLGLGPILVLLAAAILGMSIVTMLATNLQRPLLAAGVGAVWIAFVAAFRTCVTPSRARARALVNEIRDLLATRPSDPAPPT
jgi:TRAP-type mannitol/chloroaromatic compound transport system permease large subunit